MQTNASITIYNKWLNKVTKKEEIKATQIAKVNWYTDQKVVVEAGLKSADVYKIRFDSNVDTQGKTYVPWEEFIHLDPADVGNHWTIDKGSYFAKGLHGNMTISEVLTLPLSSVVLSFSDNRRGNLQHFRIGGGA